ncbi:SH3 domain-containing protein [Leptospira yanagawae]|uniref:SH3 domain-containing protein n=1 Tax=Leptospira yanagawae TaxID=293069 RepID=A0ABY2M799_9LEPT|nr:SH3 domain-containing protein [Leptospira yanagawae]TGL23792.1 SH3 domain-containing protein [Leptospira yanagawae]
MNPYQKIGIFLISILLLNGTFVSNSESNQCPKKFKCLTTFVALGSILLARELDLSVSKNSGPKALDLITIPLNENGKIKEVKIAENVFYYQVIWKGKKILISRFDLDTSKTLRTLSQNPIQLYDEPNSSAKILMNIPENIPLDVLENTHPLTQNTGYVKVKFNEKIGWVHRTSLSDDEFDIRFYKKNLRELVRPYLFQVKEKDFNTELKIIGEGFSVFSCKVGEEECSAKYRMGESSFGMPEEAVDFDLTVSGGKQYVCEMRRVDFVGELQRVIDDSITEDELDPFINCSLSESASLEEETSEESSGENE